MKNSTPVAFSCMKWIKFYFSFFPGTFNKSHLSPGRNLILEGTLFHICFFFTDFKLKLSYAVTTQWLPATNNLPDQEGDEAFPRHLEETPWVQTPFNCLDPHSEHRSTGHKHRGRVLGWVKDMGDQQASMACCSLQVVCRRCPSQHCLFLGVP